MLDIFFKLAIFFYKNISLSLCRQIAKLKLPTCGQGLRPFGHSTITSFKVLTHLKSALRHSKKTSLAVMSEPAMPVFS